MDAKKLLLMVIASWGITGVATIEFAAQARQLAVENERLRAEVATLLRIAGKIYEPPAVLIDGGT